MKKIKKSYVNKLYKTADALYSSVVEVTERDPMKVENDGLMQGFRFYDIKFIIDEDEIYVGEKSNLSNMIYFGKRLRLEDFKEKYGNNPSYKGFIDDLEKNGYQYVCHTQVDTFLPMEECDMTFDELMAERKQNREKIAKSMCLSKTTK